MDETQAELRSTAGIKGPLVVVLVVVKSDSSLPPGFTPSIKVERRVLGGCWGLETGVKVVPSMGDLSRRGRLCTATERRTFEDLHPKLGHNTSSLFFVVCTLSRGAW